MTHVNPRLTALMVAMMIVASTWAAPSQATPRGATFSTTPGTAAPRTNQQRPGLWSRIRNRQRRNPATNQAAKDRISLKDAYHKVREELQVYRGPALERWSDRLAMGRQTHNPQKSIAGNLKAMVEKHNIPHYTAQINGRDVLHVVVDLAQGKQTKKAVRGVLRSVGAQTIELNYKAATPKNQYGHVAVRVGKGATYDLTGTQGVAQLPKFLEKTLKAVRGTSNLSFARRRNLRRFMEGRKAGRSASASIYFGMLYGASPEQVKQTSKIYDKRMKQITEFKVSGGDGSKGVFSCAQFLTEGVPFLNERGVNRTVGAKGAASSGRNSPQLEAVVVYKMPGVTQEQLSQFP